MIGKFIGGFYKNPGQFNQDWTSLLAEDYQHGDAELRRNGDSVFVEFTAKADCLPGRHVMILRDITQRRRAQASLVESEERFQQMADNIREIFWMLDAETREALYVNQAYETITGRSCESLRENPPSYEELIHPEDRVHVLTKLEKATRSGHFDEKFRILGPKAGLRWVLVHIHLFNASYGLLNSHNLCDNYRVTSVNIDEECVWFACFSSTYYLGGQFLSGGCLQPSFGKRVPPPSESHAHSSTN